MSLRSWIEIGGDFSSDPFHNLHVCLAWWYKSSFSEYLQFPRVTLRPYVGVQSKLFRPRRVVDATILGQCFSGLLLALRTAYYVYYLSVFFSQSWLKSCDKFTILDKRNFVESVDLLTPTSALALFFLYCSCAAKSVSCLIARSIEWILQ